jgi:hypothetical protein
MINGAAPVKDLVPYVKALLYGPPGHGKTTFCASAPNPVWIDYEHSTETLRHWPEFENVPVIQANGKTDLSALVAKIAAGKEYETIIVDSLTTALDKYLRNRMKEVKEGKIGTSRDEFRIHEADYKYATQVFSKAFGALEECPVNVVIITHERYLFDNSDGEQKLIGIRPDVTPRLQQAVTRLVNLVGYYKMERSQLKGETTRQLYVNPTPLIEAKNRLNIQATSITNPTWKELFK